MSLNDLRLTPGILSALYPTSLVNLDTDQTSYDPGDQQPPIVEKPAGPALKFLGNNQKNILVVVNHDEAVHLPDEDLSFLTKLLAASKLSLDDVAVINKKNYPGETSKQILHDFNSKIVFLFGIDPVSFGMPVNFPAYQVQLVGQVTFLFTPAISEQRDDKLLKSKLWISFRNIFNI